MSRTLIIGGGIAGLTAAHRLARNGRDVVCLEARDVAGGVVRTHRSGGYLCEVGPQNFLEVERGPASALASELGLDNQLVEATDARAYLYHAGSIRQLPRDIVRLLSFRAIGRALLEPLVPKGPSSRDETVLAWGARRFGKEVAELLLDPAAVGMCVGDPAALSARSTLRALVDLEQQHGSVIRAVVRRRVPRRRARSFREGMGALAGALASQLGDALQTGVVVDAIQRRQGGGFRVAITRRGDHRETLDADTVIAATPAAVTARLAASLDEALSAELGAIPFAPVATCALSFSAHDFAPAAPQGYGLMAPTGDGLRIRGCLFSSWCSGITACPPGEILLRALLGGRLDPGIVALSDDQIEAVCVSELRRPLGLREGARAIFRRVDRIEPGLPQYEVGHDARVATIQARARRIGDLHVLGSSYEGIAVSHVVEHAERLAASVLRGSA